MIFLGVIYQSFAFNLLILVHSYGMCLDREMMFYKCVSYYAKHKSNQKRVHINSNEKGMQIVWMKFSIMVK